MTSSHRKFSFSQVTEKRKSDIKETVPTSKKEYRHVEFMTIVVAKRFVSKLPGLKVLRFAVATGIMSKFYVK